MGIDASVEYCKAALDIAGLIITHPAWRDCLQPIYQSASDSLHLLDASLTVRRLDR